MSFLKKYRLILIPLMLWMVIIGAFWIFALRNNLSPLDFIQRLGDFLVNHPYGPLFFLAFFAIRPLLLIPSKLVIPFAGFLYGPLWGFVYALIGDIISAMVAYGVGFYYGPRLLQTMEKQDRITRYVESLRRKAYETIFKTRLFLFQYDVVSYSAGIGRVNWKSFLRATVLGSLGATAALVLFGASISVDSTTGSVSLNWTRLLLAIVVFILSLAVAWYLHQREKQAEDGST